MSYLAIRGKGTHIMLVLARNVNDRVVFPQLDITLEILKIRGNTVKLGFNAPDWIRILRHEISNDSFDGSTYAEEQSRVDLVRRIGSSIEKLIKFRDRAFNDVEDPFGELLVQLVELESHLEISTSQRDTSTANSL